MQFESDPKIQSYWLQITVDLLIFYWDSSQCLSIDSAFCCWFVDFWNGRELKSLSYWFQNTVDLLICWAVELLSCWAVELLSCWAVELLSFWAVLRLNSALSCWFVDFLKCKTQKFRVNGRKTLLICWFYIRFLLSVWVLIVHFSVDLLIFEMAPFKELKNLS